MKSCRLSRPVPALRARCASLVLTGLLALALLAPPPAFAGYADAPHIPTTPDEMTTLVQQELAKAQAALDQLLAVSGKRTVENTLVPYNQLGIHVDLAGAMSGLLENVHPDEALRASAEAASQEVSKFVTKLGLNRDFYEAMKAVDLTGADAATKFMVEESLRNFRRAGVDKDEATRAKIEMLNEELVKIGQEFDRNIREDRRSITLDSVEELDGLPQDYIDAHKPDESGKITITTDYPDYFPFTTYAKNEAARRKLYLEFQKRGNPKNIETLERLVKTRTELAQTLGYDTWADFMTEDKMIGSKENAAAFIDKISTAATPRAQQEYQEMLGVKKRFDETATEVGDYDKFFLAEVLKREKYGFDSQAARAYFDYPIVKDGIIQLTQDLFGVQFKKLEGVPVWHPEVECYEIYEGPKFLGRIYLDMHPREGKYGHAAQFTMRTGVKDIQAPIGVLVCNFPGSKDQKPGEGLMGHDEFETYLHEFGHLIHHVFGGHQKWIDQSGVATEWDFVEAPSQFLEEWATDPKTLQRLARHYETGQPIPMDMIEKLRAARDFGEYGKAMQVRHQMFYAKLSLSMYDRDPASIKDQTSFVGDIQNNYSMFKQVPGTTMQTGFGHLNGYSAIYYTYMWSQVIAKDLFSRFDTKNLLDTKTSMAYRKAVLDAGGTKPAAELVKDFLGRESSFDAYEKWLNSSPN
jgi:thimet oligopeptidase